MARIRMVISGGQTGADLGALEAAQACKVPHGGWCPAGRRQEGGGTIPACYSMKETVSTGWEERTELNVMDSDATIVFTMGQMTPGSGKTVSLAHRYGRPCLHADLSSGGLQGHSRAILEWLEGISPGEGGVVVNVAGTRGSKAPGLQAAVKEVMESVIKGGTGGP